MERPNVGLFYYTNYLQSGMQKNVLLKFNPNVDFNSLNFFFFEN